MSYSPTIQKSNNYSFNYNDLEYKEVQKIDDCNFSPEITLDETDVYLPGSLESDSPRDRLFYYLYKKGVIDQFGRCLSSNLLGNTEIESCAFDEMLKFSNHKVTVSCTSKTTALTYSTTFPFISLLRHLNKYLPSDFFFIGSHLQEIVEKNGYLLNNLKKIIGDHPLLDFIKLKNVQTSGDSDIRVFPAGDISNQHIKDLTQQVINFIAERIYSDSANKRFLYTPDFTSQTLAQYVRFTSLFNFNFYDSSKYFPDKENNTIYSIISIKDEIDKPIDLMFIKEIENSCLFSFDDLKINLFGFVTPKLNNFSKKLELSSSTSPNTWQYIIDQSLYLLHCPNLDTCDDMGWLRLLRHMTKGGKFLEDGLDVALFKKIDLSRLPKLIEKYFEKLKSADNTGITALYFHIVAFLKKNNIENQIINQIKRPVRNKAIEQKNLFECILGLLDEEKLPFEFIYSYIHILLFLEHFNSNSQVVISRCGIEPVLEISKEFFLRTSGSIPKAFNDVSSYLKNNNLSTKTKNALDELKSHLKGLGSHNQKVADLEKKLLLFEVDSKSLLIIAKDILNHGYDLSLICYSETLIKETALALLQNFPMLDEAEQLKIRQPLIDMLPKATFSNFKSVLADFSKSKLKTPKVFTDLLIAKIDLNSYLFIFDFWSTTGLEQQEKKTSGLLLLDKIMKYDLKLAVTLFKTLRETNLLTQNEQNQLFKKLYHSYERKPSLENLNELKNVLNFVMSKTDTSKAIEGEILGFVKNLVDHGLKDDASKILLLGIKHFFVSLQKASSNEDTRGLLKQNFLFEENLKSLKNEIAKGNFRNSLNKLKELLNLERSEDESSLLRASIDDIFVTFCKLSNFSEIYSSLVSPAFQKLYASHFKEKSILSHLYLESANKKKLETPQILELLLESIQEGFSCPAKEFEKFSNSLIYFISDIHAGLNTSFKASLSKKLPIILKSLSSHNLNELSINLITAMNNQKIHIARDETTVDLILNISLKGIEDKNLVASICKVFSTIKLHTCKLKNNAKLMKQAYFLLMEKLININLVADAKKLLEDWITFEEPDLETLYTFRKLFSGKEKDLDVYILIVNALLSHLKETEENLEIFDKLTTFIETDKRLYKKDIIQNSYFDFKLTLLNIHKLLISKNPKLVLWGFNLFHYHISQGLSKLIEVNSCHLDIEKLFLAMIASTVKFELQDKIELTKNFESCIHQLFTYCPKIFSLINLTTLTDAAVKSDNPLMYSINGQILFFLLSNLKVKAGKPLQAGSIKLLNKVLSHPEYFSIRNKENILEKLLWSFANLESFDLHFDSALKAKIIGTILSTQLAALKTSLDLEDIQNSIILLIENIPAITAYPEYEHACVDQAFDLLIPWIEVEETDFFITNLYRILSNSNDYFFSLDDPKFVDYQAEYPDKIFKYMASITNKLLKCNFKDKSAGGFALTCIYELCNHLMSNLSVSMMESKVQSSNLKQVSISATKNKTQNPPKKVMIDNKSHFLCNEKKTIFLEIMRKLMYYPPALNSVLFPHHMENFTLLCKGLFVTNALHDQVKINDIFKLYVTLDVNILKISSDGILNQHLMDDTLSMIKNFIKSETEVGLVKAIDLYRSAQRITDELIFKGKLRPYVEPEKLRNCFNEIQAAILKNPFYDTTVEYEDTLIADIEKDPDVQYENQYFYFYFLSSLLNNPYLLNSIVSRDWSNHNAEVLASYSQTLMTLHKKQEIPQLKKTLLNSVFIFMIKSNGLSCYKNHFSTYFPLLKEFSALFLEQIKTLKNNPELANYLKYHIFMSLFNINRPLKAQEILSFHHLAKATLKELFEINDPLLNDYVNAQLKIAFNLKIFNAKEILLFLSKNY